MSAEKAQVALLERLSARPSDLPALEDLRAAAAQSFRERGLPTQRLEAWRFTDLRALDALAWDTPETESARAASAAEGSVAERSASEAAAPKTSRADSARPEAPAHSSLRTASPADLALPELIAGPLAHADRVVLVDGVLASALSRTALPVGVQLGSLRDVLAQPGASRPGVGTLADFKERALTALNTALFEDGTYLRVPAGVALERPIVLVHLASGRRRDVHPRVWIELGVNSRACVIEHYVGCSAEGVLSNAVTEVWLGDGAALDHIQLQEQGDASAHFAQLVVRQERDSRLRSHSLAIGSALARADIRSELIGEGAHAQLHGLYLARGSQLLDHRTEIDHAAPHTSSDELYKGILRDRAKGVFCGFVQVRPHAQKIDAKQTNRALLLSDSAAVHTRPQLEIHADDVRCSHGASIGQLDADALFYLRARGIGEAEARALLTSAFVEDVLVSLPSEVADEVRARLLLQRGEA